MDQVTRDTSPHNTKRRVLLASFVGTAIEWYDFFIYGTAATLVLGKLFFPSVDPLAGTLAALATFGVGFLARPVGGVICGHFGDKIGRKKLLVFTLSTMGISTVVVGILPTYNQIGIWAPLLLILARLAQGFAVGGEWGGAVLMAVEHSPARRRGLYGSAPQMGVPAGLLLATGVFAVVSQLSAQQFQSWGWRIPFVASFVLVAVGLVVRLAVLESPAFLEAERSESLSKNPLGQVLRVQRKSVLITAGARVAENGLFYIFAVFSITYATTVAGLPKSTILIGITIAAAVELITIPIFGALTDQIGRKPVYLFGAAFSLAFSFPFFALLNSHSALLSWLAVTLGLAVGHSGMYAPQAAFFSELFDTNVRYSGASLGYQVTAAIVGGFTPLLAVVMLHAAGNSAWPVATYMMVLSAITLVAVLLAQETYKSDLAVPAPQTKPMSKIPSFER